MITTTSSLSRFTLVASLLFVTTGFVAGQNVINGSFEAGIDPPKSFTDKEYANYWCYEFRKVQPQKANAEASTSK